MKFIKVCKSLLQFKYTVFQIRLMIVIREKFVEVWTNFGNLIENFKSF